MIIAVLLGHRLNDDGTMSLTMKSRLDLALLAIREIRPDRLILSGGIANRKAKISEASTMMDYLLENGVPKEILYIEDRSTTTKENARYSVQIAKGLKADTLLLISSYHHFTRWYLNPIPLFQKEIGDADIRLMTYTSCK